MYRVGRRNTIFHFIIFRSRCRRNCYARFVLITTHLNVGNCHVSSGRRYKYFGSSLEGGVHIINTNNNSIFDDSWWVVARRTASVNWWPWPLSSCYHIPINTIYPQSFDSLNTTQRKRYDVLNTPPPQPKRILYRS